MSRGQKSKSNTYLMHWNNVASSIDSNNNIFVDKIWIQSVWNEIKIERTSDMVLHIQNQQQYQIDQNHAGEWMGCVKLFMFGHVFFYFLSFICSSPNFVSHIRSLPYPFIQNIAIIWCKHEQKWKIKRNRNRLKGRVCIHYV